MKGVIVHALLAVFGLAFAYQTYTREPEEETIPGGVTVAECSLDQLEKVTLDTATVEVTAEPVREGDSVTYWITSRHRPPEEVTTLDPNVNPRKGGDSAAPSSPAETAEAEATATPHSTAGAGAAGNAADASDDAAADAADTADTADTTKPEANKPVVSEAHKPKRFLANPTFQGYLRRLTPVRALRSLGKLDDNADAGFGFGKVLGFLELTCAGRRLELQSGDRAFGASQRYLRDVKTGVVYLFDEPTISDLESAQFKFMQTDLHTFKPADIEEVTIEAQGAKKKLLQRDRKLPSAQWVDEAEPAKRNELYGNWFARLNRLRAREYLDPSAEPGSDLKNAGSVTHVLRATYKVAGQPNGTLELVRVDENGVGHYYARTETTHAWVALFDSAAKDVEQDVGMVVGAEAPAAPAEPRPKAASPSGQAPAKSNEDFLPAGHPRIPAGH